MKISRLALTTLTLLWMATPVVAHYGANADVRTVQAGPYDITLSPLPTPLFVNARSHFELYMFRDGSSVAPPPMNITLTISGSPPITLGVTGDENGATSDHFTWATAGKHTLLVAVQDGATRREAAATLDVYPDLPYRINPGDSSADVRARVPINLTFDVLDARTGKAFTSLEDLRVRSDRLADDGVTRLGQEERTLARMSPSRWAITHTFAEPGLYDWWFASTSGNLTYGQAPRVQVYALNLDPASSQPGFGTLAVLAGLVVVGLLLRR